MSEIIATSMYSKNLKLDWNYSVYIPESWNHDSHLPVLCLFHGAYGNHTNVVVYLIPPNFSAVFFQFSAIFFL